MQLHSSLRTLSQIAVAACLLAGSVAHAQPAPAPSVPAGWVFQGTWHDGRWDGEWVPGGAPGMMQGMPQGPMVQDTGPGYAPMADRESQHMMDRCRKHHHDDMAQDGWHGSRRDHECERFYHEHHEFAGGYGSQAPYGAPMGPYGQMPYAPAPMGYMMVPMMQPAQPAYTETKTVTTTYVTDRDVVHYHHAVHARRHDKRVYIGS